MKRLFIFLLFGWYFNPINSSAQLQNDSPFSAQFDQILAEPFKANGPGCAALVAHKGKIIYQKAFGKADLELNVPMRPDMVFTIASITKQFTAIAVLQLLEQGKLSLQDPVTRFLPNYPTSGKTITVEHLLTHTSGIKNLIEISQFWEQSRNKLTPLAMIDLFKDQPLEFESGTQWSYSNSGYILLGQIIEKASGKPYPQYLKEMFFEPLRMTHSSYYEEAKIISNRVRGYQLSKDGENQNADYINLESGYSTGGILSTVGDLWIWHQAVHSHKLVKKETLAKALTPYRLSTGKLTDYGYGWFIDSLQNSPLIWHSGAINGFRSYCLYLPSEDVFVTVLANSIDKSATYVSKRMAALASGKPLLIDQQHNLHRLDKYVGKYEDSAKNTYTITHEGEQFFARLPSTSQKQTIVPATETKFLFKDSNAEIEFREDRSGTTVMQTRIYGGPTSQAKKIK
ncbi:hypothetical protein GCM10028808_56330 [Spirosoma migulaei]